MPTRQYIGARYVPKFYENSVDHTAEWTSNTQYEGLTIVTRNGNSYTSRKPVPANIGAPEDYPEYWVSTGIFNEQVEQLRQNIEEFESETTLALGTINGKIDSLEDAVYPRENVIMIGDSYGHASGGGNGWIDKLKLKMGLDAANLFETAIGGAGFNTSLSPNDFNTMFNTLIGSMTEDEIANVGTVIIAGGSNDAGVAVNTLTGYVLTCINNIVTHCPNAKVYIGEISGAIANDFATANLPRIVQAYKAATMYDRVYYLNNVEYCLHERNNLNIDSVHPNADGYEILTNAMYAAMRDAYNYKYTSYGNVVTKASGASGTDAVYCVDIDNGYAQLTFTVPIDYTFDTAVDFTGGNNVKLGTLANKAIIGASIDYYNFNRTLVDIPITCRFATTTTLHLASCVLWIDDDGDIYIRNYDYEQLGSSGGWSEIDRFILPRFQISAPTIGC